MSSLPTTSADDSAVPRTNEVLALAAADGDRDAFAILVDRLHGPLFQFLVRRCTSSDDAEELTQEAFLRAWQNLGLYDSRWKFSTWLFTLAQRQAVSRYRRRRPALLEDEALEDFASYGCPVTTVSQREERDNLWALAARVLTVAQRTALWLRYAEALSAREIGRVLGKSESGARVLLFRARERLASHLEPSSGASVMRPRPVILTDGTETAWEGSST